MRTIRFLTPAQAEADEAVAYFDAQRVGLGDRFDQDLQETLDFVSKYPLSGKRIPKNLRKFRLRKFKYNVVYVFEADEILIVAVAHHRRRPGYWLNRLGIIN